MLTYPKPLKITLTVPALAKFYVVKSSRRVNSTTQFSAVRMPWLSQYL